MDKKEQIVEILKNNLKPNATGHDTSIHRIYFDDIAEQIVSLLGICNISDTNRKLPHPHVIWRKASEENAMDFEIWYNRVYGNSH